MVSPKQTDSTIGKSELNVSSAGGAVQRGPESGVQGEWYFLFAISSSNSNQ